MKIKFVKTKLQIAIATFAALAIFVVFICPFTFGLPAAKQKRSQAAMLLGWSAALLAALMARAAAAPTPGVCPPSEPPSTADRLTLICTRLC